MELLLIDSGVNEVTQQPQICSSLENPVSGPDSLLSSQGHASLMQLEVMKLHRHKTGLMQQCIRANICLEDPLTFFTNYFNENPWF